MTFRVLVVCTGNICRSPMGEIVLRQRLRDAGIDEVEVRSAGVSTEESGNPVDSRARAVLAEHGYDTSKSHRAHRATDDELRTSDLILAMTVGHARSLRRMVEAAGGNVERIHLWREFDGSVPFAEGGVFSDAGALGKHSDTSGVNGSGKRSRYSDFYSSDGSLDVADPWYGGKDGFYATLDTVEQGADGIVQWLRGSAELALRK